MKTFKIQKLFNLLELPKVMYHFNIFKIWMILINQNLIKAKEATNLVRYIVSVALAKSHLLEYHNKLHKKYCKEVNNLLHWQVCNLDKPRSSTILLINLLMKSLKDNHQDNYQQKVVNCQINMNHKIMILTIFITMIKLRLYKGMN